MNTEKLKALAEKATRGPWVPFVEGRAQAVFGPRGVQANSEGCVVNWPGFDSSSEPVSKRKANARFIAAANPAAVLELIADLESAVEERDQLRAEVESLLAAAPAAPVVQSGPAVRKILDLILGECKYWNHRDEARRGGFAALYAKAKKVADAAPPANDAALVEAEWDGEGLPPVGTICEANNGGDSKYFKCEVVAMHYKYGRPILKTDGFGGPSALTLAPECWKFRPMQSCRAALAGKGGE